MNGFVRCVAVDYDGTLTLGGPVPTATAAAIAAVRANGVKVLMVTGRILDELVAVDPDVIDLVDAVVAENGAVVYRGGVRRPLADPIDPRLAAVARERGASLRRGDVILAGRGDDRATIGDIAAELGLDVQLVANRSELMVVPAGVTKASGLRHALDAFGGDRHNTLAIGDAENDLAMLSSCEFSAAVANAVESARAIADITTRQPAGAGVAEVLRSPVMRLGSRPGGSRWQLVLGSDITTGQPATLPAAGVNLLVSGPSGSGKSYVTGLLVEQLVELEYSVLVLDPEGDHVMLGQLGGVTSIAGDGPFPSTNQLGDLLTSGPRSLVVDLSQRPADARAALVRQVCEVAEAARAASGRPHWVVVDEAHLAADPRTSAAFLRSSQAGHLLVTYLPHSLPPELLAALDGEIRALDDHREADVELRYPADAPPRPIRLAARATPHARHWHKYCSNQLPRELGFHFRDGSGQPTGTVALCLADLAAELLHCGSNVLRHHAEGADFSRWVADVFHYADLAASLADAEAVLRSSDARGDEDARRAMVGALTESGCTSGTSR